LKLPLGFLYAAAYAGIRKTEQDDVGLIYAEKPAQAAAVFTQNVVQAAPVRLARKHLAASKGRVSAVLVNAGNANCATRTGDDVAIASCKTAAKALKTKREYIFPASTGVIGVELDPKLLTGVIPELVSKLSPDGFESVAKAIMTTDTRMKIAAEEVIISGKTVRIAGMTKGSGMIHPNMATTLGFVMMDATLTAKQLHEILVAATRNSYNSLTVDGDTSTNDVVVLLANGASGVKPGSKDREALQKAVSNVMESLAQQIAADGEGARKLIVIRASGFANEDEARKIAGAIASSPLVKTAIAGSDPNWGRILSAAGYSGVLFDPSKVDIYLQDVLVCRRGLAAEYDENNLKESLNGTEVRISLHYAGRGKGEARYFTCDLTEGYIQINGSYRT
jgi:glutamate N-acetyltransferase / amino-acid N-acetyltransferase